MSMADLEGLALLADSYARLRREAGKIIVGQEAVLEQLLIAIFARGHCLLVGVPGLAKTLMVRTLSDALSLSFSRVQFTPDLMPSDITGTEVIEQNRSTGEREFRFLRGPIFAHLVLADEINRTPPKTQAALLEAMQEHSVTVGGVRYGLEEPFFVLATQNPIEQEGTYPLPEAQLDRFMLQVLVEYPREEEEFEIVRQTTGGQHARVEKTLSAAEVIALQEIVRRIPAPDPVIRYAMHLARATRRDKHSRPPEFIERYIEWGAGPRASQYLVLAGKARAALHGRDFVTTEDIRALAAPVLRHRLITNFTAEAEGITPDDIVRMLIDTVPVEGTTLSHGRRLPEVLGSGDARAFEGG